MTGRRILLLAQSGDATTIVFNAISRNFEVPAVLLEPAVPRRFVLKRRVRKLGLATVVGQMAFRGLVMGPLAHASKARIREICQQHRLDLTQVPERVIQRVPSVNSDEARRILQAASPALVVVNGTRIIDEKTLSAVPAPFINTHAGITPLYRGVHGAYWALAQNDPEHCGVTVHLVDTGIDTGQILGQSTISPTSKDNFTTYPYLQYAAALPLLLSSISALLQGTTTTLPAPAGASRLWSHPTLSQYVRNRVLVGAR